MGESDIKSIVINNKKIGIVGLRAVVESMAVPFSGKKDEEIEAELLKRLSEVNYIPKRVEAEYGRAFLREYKEVLGIPHEAEEPVAGLEIEILGPGCARCDLLINEVMDVLSDMGIAAAVGHVSDIREIARYGVIGAPALIINRKVVCVGQVPERGKIEKWIAEAAQGGKT